MEVLPRDIQGLFLLHMDLVSVFGSTCMVSQVFLVIVLFDLKTASFFITKGERSITLKYCTLSPL